MKTYFKKELSLISVFFVFLGFGCATTTNTVNKSREFSIMTFNIHHANPPSRPGLIDVDAIVGVIRRSNADAVLLQEVDVFTKRSGRIDQAKQIAEKLGVSYYFFKAIDYDDGEYGLAILSRFPLKNPQTIRLPMVENAEGRVLALIQVKVENKWIYLVNTHLDASKLDNNRLVQMRFIAEKATALRHPVILGGDLNSVPTSEAIKVLDSYFIRTCLNDCLPTAPQLNPRNTIDYIATKNIPWQLNSVEVLEEIYASDHRPVKATFKLK